MALQIIDQQEDRVYIGGYIDLKQINANQVSIMGLDVDIDEEYTTEANAEDVASFPGFGAGRILRFICNKIKEALCDNCNPTNPD